MVYLYLVFLMDTEVKISFKVINTLGQEVALYVKKYYLKVLTNSSHFKARNYKQALEESFINLD